MFIGRSSAERRGERAHRGAGEATAPGIRPGLTVLVGYPLPSTSLSCHWTEDRPKAVRISGKSGAATGVGLPSGDKENDLCPVARRLHWVPPSSADMAVSTDASDPRVDARRRRTVAWVVGLATLGMIFDGYDLVVYGAVCLLSFATRHK